MKKKKVLFISLGWEQLPLIQLLHARTDTELYGLHYPGILSYPQYFKTVFQSDYRDLVSISKFIESIQPDAIISDEDDYGMFLQAYFSEVLDLPGPKIYQAQIACNKFLQRTLAKEKNISIPEFQLCSSPDQVAAFASKVQYPIILKPIDSRGSMGVTKISNPAEISNAFTKAIEKSPSLLTIAERFIDGKHFNVDGYCFLGGIGPKSLAVSANIKEDDGQEVVNQRLIYGNLPETLRSRLMEEGETVAKSLGFNFGFFHGEFIKCNLTDKIYLTEMANRGGGILISETILPYVTELPLLEIYAGDCLSNSFSLTEIIPRNKYASIDFVNLEIGKIFQPIDINQFDSPDYELLQIVPFLEKGDKIPLIGDGSKRHVMILSNIKDPQSLDRIKNSIRSMVEG